MLHVDASDLLSNTDAVHAVLDQAVSHDNGRTGDIQNANSTVTNHTVQQGDRAIVARAYAR